MSGYTGAKIITKGRSGLITKADLKRYRSIDKEMGQIERLMKRLRERAEAPRISIVSDMPRGRGEETDSMAAHTVRIDELMRRYDSLWDELIDLQQRIEAAVAGLDSLERLAIRSRFFEKKSWVAVGMQLGCSDRNAVRIIDGAIDKLANIKSVS